jgi:RNA polymerase subunit RPABC4/transcription elongation factor Spt4
LEEAIMELFLIIAWLVLCGAAAVYASNKGRSGAGIFFLSLFLSPLVGFLVALVMEPNQQMIAAAKGMKKCPECAQFVQPDARTCPFCKTNLSTDRFSRPGESSPDALSKKCPDCAETIKMEALVCRFCGHKFQPAEVQAAIQQAKAKFEGNKEEFVPAFLANAAPAQESWLASHVNLLAIVVLILGILVAIVVFR